MPERVQRPHQRLAVGHRQRRGRASQPASPVLLCADITRLTAAAVMYPRAPAAIIASIQSINLLVVGDRQRDTRIAAVGGGGGGGVVEAGRGDRVKIPVGRGSEARWTARRRAVAAAVRCGDLHPDRGERDRQTTELTLDLFFVGLNRSSASRRPVRAFRIRSAHQHLRRPADEVFRFCLPLSAFVLICAVSFIELESTGEMIEPEIVRGMPEQVNSATEPVLPDGIQILADFCS